MRSRETPGPLSKVDAVIVKDSWNKFLAFDEMLIEMFFERLILDLPELVDQFGVALDQAPAEFLALIDGAVRGLCPMTERTLRESYNVAPGAQAARGRTTAEFGGLLLDLWRDCRSSGGSPARPSSGRWARRPTWRISSART